MSRTLKERLNNWAEHDAKVSGSDPLLSESEVLSAIRSDKTVAEPDTFWQRHKVALTTGATLAAAATVISIVALPEDADLATPVVGSKDDIAQFEPVQRESTQQAPARFLTEDETREVVGNMASDASGAATPEVEELQLVPSGIDSKMLKLSEHTLGDLDLQVETSTITFEEDGRKVIVKTSGINVGGSRKSQDQVATSSSVSPRAITLYRSGKVQAHWARSEFKETNVNDLVPVSIRLNNSSNTIFPHADVVLWYEPSVEFVNRLPDAYRLALGKELRSNDPTSVLVERNTASATISSSRVFPNPVTDDGATLQLNVDRPCTASVEVMDINGRTVFSVFKSQPLTTGSNQTRINNLSTLANGMYVVVVTIDGSAERIVQRLLIER